MRLLSGSGRSSTEDARVKDTPLALSCEEDQKSPAADAPSGGGGATEQCLKDHRSSSPRSAS